MMLVEALSRDVYQTKLQLANVLGWKREVGRGPNARLEPDTRRVENEIERLRKSGQYPIMSGPDGYRLARNPDEYELNVQARRRRALGQLVTVRGERDYINRWREHLNPKPPPPPPPPEPKQETLRW